MTPARRPSSAGSHYPFWWWVKSSPEGRRIQALRTQEEGLREPAHAPGCPFDIGERAYQTDGWFPPRRASQSANKGVRRNRVRLSASTWVPMKEMSVLLLPDSSTLLPLRLLFSSPNISHQYSITRRVVVLMWIRLLLGRTYVRERESGINIYGKCWCVGISHYYGCNSSSVCNQSLWGNLSSLCSLMLLQNLRRWIFYAANGNGSLFLSIFILHVPSSRSAASRREIRRSSSST